MPAILLPDRRGRPPSALTTWREALLGEEGVRSVGVDDRLSLAAAGDEAQRGTFGHDGGADRTAALDDDVDGDRLALAGVGVEGLRLSLADVVHTAGLEVVADADGRDVVAVLGHA